jgi:uncharacterized protein (DUF952 family)
MVKLIYKICPASIWGEAKTRGIFEGWGIDLIDGYIHFSTAEQVAQTAARHFVGQRDLVLVTVDATHLSITWEPARDGDLFPHLYDALPMTAIIRVVDIPVDHNNQHAFPGEIPICS